jgi:D-xylose transport system substrate-binding protein
MRKTTISAALISAALFLAACTAAPPSQPAGNTAAPAGGKIRIGFSMDTLKEERWQRDRDLFVKHAEAMGAVVNVQAANGDDRVQIQQAENLLTQGVDVLVVVPHNSQVAAAIVEAAKRQNVPVIAYDRMITNSDLDLYVSYDAVKIGEQQAQYLLERVPKGNYVIIQGAPSDNNAHVLRQGHMKVLQPAIDRGDVKVVAEQWARDWLASEALNHTENALTQNNNNVQAVLAANDGTSGGASQALEGQGLTGKVVLTGQDAELAALQRIVQGRQSMTIYKPIEPLAKKAAEVAIALAKRQPVQSSSTINNGQKDVPAILLESVVVDKDNIRDTVVKDGYHTAEAIGLK